MRNESEGSKERRELSQLNEEELTALKVGLEALSRAAETVQSSEDGQQN
jgi:hypothetical protein